MYIAIEWKTTGFHLSVGGSSNKPPYPSLLLPLMLMMKMMMMMMMMRSVVDDVAHIVANWRPQVADRPRPMAKRGATTKTPKT